MNLLKKIYGKSRWFRLMLTPIRNAQRSLRRSRHESNIKRLQFFLAMLADDPVLNVDEFRGKFSIGKNSSILQKLIIDGSYEAKISRLVPLLAPPSKDAIDIGANLGFYSVLLSKLLPKRLVLAFEPVDEALDRLRTNLLANHVTQNVHVCPMIASDASGSTEMKIIIGQEEYSTVGSMEHPNVIKTEYVTRIVKCTTVDAEANRLGLTPGFIKIDAEGSENDVLKGCSETIRKHRPIILSEFSSVLLEKNGSSAEEVLSFLEDLHYVAIDPLNPSLAFYAKDFGDALFVPKERRDEVISTLSAQKLHGALHSPRHC